MTNLMVPFFRPQIGKDEISEVVDCLENGWLTTGKKAAEFERCFSEYLGGEVESIAVNSATAGLHLALEAVGIQSGDEVIIPDYTFTATAEVVRYLGAEPVLVDVDYDSLCVSVKNIENAITKNTKAIMPVHLGGLACDMTALVKLASSYGLHIVEDSAHALPTTHAGIKVGNFNTAASVFSFYANKTMTTGEGGMLVTRDPEIADRARKMRLHGFDRDALDRFHTGSWRYDIIGPGYKYNLTDIAAAIGLHQLKKLDKFRSEREAIAERYFEGLENLPLELPMRSRKGDVHSWHLFIVRVKPNSGIDRDVLFDRLKEAGITCSVHYTPLHNFSYWKQQYNLSPEDFPHSERAGLSAISLPIFPGMTEKETDYVIKKLSQILA